VWPTFALHPAHIQPTLSLHSAYVQPVQLTFSLYPVSIELAFAVPSACIQLAFSLHFVSIRLLRILGRSAATSNDHLLPYMQNCSQLRSAEACFVVRSASARYRVFTHIYASYNAFALLNNKMQAITSFKHFVFLQSAFGSVYQRAIQDLCGYDENHLSPIPFVSPSFWLSSTVRAGPQLCHARYRIFKGPEA